MLISFTSKHDGILKAGFYDPQQRSFFQTPLDEGFLSSAGSYSFEQVRA